MTRVTEGCRKEYKTGSGQTRATLRRVLIYQQEGNISPHPKNRRKNKNDEILKTSSMESFENQFSLTIDDNLFEGAESYFKETGSPFRSIATTTPVIPPPAPFPIAENRKKLQKVKSVCPTTYLGHNFIPPLKIPTNDDPFMMKDLRITPPSAGTDGTQKTTYYLNSPSTGAATHRNSYSPINKSSACSPVGNTLRFTRESNCTTNESQSYSQRSLVSSEIPPPSPYSGNNTNNLRSTRSSNHSLDTQRSNTVLEMTELAIASHHEIIGIHNSLNYFFMNNQSTSSLPSPSHGNNNYATDPLSFLDVESFDNDIGVNISLKADAKLVNNNTTTTMASNNGVDSIDIEVMESSDKDDVFSTESQKGLFLSIFDTSSAASVNTHDNMRMSVDIDDEGGSINTKRSLTNQSVISHLSNPNDNTSTNVSESNTNERSSFTTVKSVTFKEVPTMIGENDRNFDDIVMSEKFESLSLKRDDQQDDGNVNSNKDVTSTAMNSPRNICSNTTNTTTTGVNISSSIQRSNQRLSSKLFSNVNAFIHKLMPSSSVTTATMTSSTEIRKELKLTTNDASLENHIQAGDGNSNNNLVIPSHHDSYDNDDNEGNEDDINNSSPLARRRADSMKSSGSNKIHPSTKRLKCIKDKIKSSLGLSDKNRQSNTTPSDSDSNVVSNNNCTNPRYNFSATHVSVLSQK